MPLSFKLLDAASGVFVYPDDPYDGMAAEFDGVLDARDSGQLTDKQYLLALDRLIAEASDFVDAHAHYAIHWHRQGKPKKALDAAMLGLSLSNRHIPEGFSGCIDWGHLDNRPYLRCMHIALLSTMRLRRPKDSLALIELMLTRNPNDNQGVRYLLGSEALRAGDHDRARRAFEANAEGFPPYFYELALSHMLRDEWVPAATALRRGFVANPYIAEIICGNPNPVTLTGIWHGTNMAEPETAHDYIQMYGMLWRMHPESMPFTRWLFNQPRVMMERAAIRECQESLAWEHESSNREQLSKRKAKLMAGIDDTLSAAIVSKRQTLRGKAMVWPWAV